MTLIKKIGIRVGESRRLAANLELLGLSTLKENRMKKIKKIEVIHYFAVLLTIAYLHANECKRLKLILKTIISCLFSVAINYSDTFVLF